MKRPGSSSTGKNSEWQGMEYEVYRLSKKEWVLYGAKGILYLALLSFVFYRSVWVFLALLPLGICYPLLIKKELKRKRQEALAVQFKDAILSVASNLNAGFSVENAFAAALKETDRIYGKDSMMSEEIRLMLHKTRVNRTFEEAFENFAERSGLEDVKSFAAVFLAARRSGGELMKMIAKTAEIIAEKIRIQEDILTATAAKRMEQKVMSAIPFLMVGYIELTSPGFFDVLYETAVGRVLMTVCLAVYLGAYWMSRGILEIGV